MSFRPSPLAALAVVALTTSSFISTPALAIVPDSRSEVDTDEKGLALQGYDAVAYFTDGQPKKGDPRFQTKLKGVTYYFASADHLKKFKASPNAYLPQFGGFCAMGTAMSHKFEGDPNVWKIVDNKLYLNFNPDVGRRWSQDVPGNISRADDNWPQIKDKTPKEIE
jgi:YHS domain-containing protein